MIKLPAQPEWSLSSNMVATSSFQPPLKSSGSSFLAHPSVRQAVWTVPTGAGVGALLGNWINGIVSSVNKTNPVVKELLQSLKANYHLTADRNFSLGTDQLAEATRIFGNNYKENPNFLNQVHDVFSSKVEHFQAVAHTTNWQHALTHPNWITGLIGGAFWTGLVGGVMSDRLDKKAKQMIANLEKAIAEKPAEASTEQEGN